MSTQQTEKRERFISLRVKLLVGFTVLFSVVFAAAFYWFYSFATDHAMGRIEEDLVDTLNGAIAGIDGDEFIALVTEGKPRDDGLTDDPRYWEHLDWLETVHDVEPRAFPYTYAKGDEPNEVLFVGDATVLIAPDREAAAFLEPYVSKGPLYRGLSELKLHTRPPGAPYTDKWGSWVSAYAPIRNSAGEIVGGMGIDFRADYVFQVQQGIRDVMVLAFLVVYAVLFILVFVISNSLTRPIIALTTIAENVAEGDYDQDTSALYSGTLRDEVSTLARVFEMMIGKVQAREESLKRQVQELRIEIDQTKKTRHVQEIVESDYFKELQASARKMRERARQDQDDE
jgi:HAMP domain-containing protein